jgi:hypothetical protein
MARETTRSFNPSPFLTQVGKGRTLHAFRKKHEIYSQASPADAVFYLQKGKVKLSVVIWVTNLGSNSVTKLNGNDGSTVGTFAVGANPTDVAFDGTNIWVTNFGGSSVSKLSAPHRRS